MPEGPEVHIEAARIVHNVGLGQRVEVSIDYEPIKNVDPSPTKLETVQAFGKAIVLSFAGSQSLYSHNQLYGKWCFSDDRNYWWFRNRTRRLRLESNIGWAELYSASSVEWLDSKTIMEHPYIKRLGPDALDDKTNVEDVKNQLQNPKFRNRSLHTLLLDQSFVAGLGNYLRSEILFRTSLAPTLRPKDLNTFELEILAEEILKAPRGSVANPGLTLDLELQKWLIKNYRVTRSDKRFWVFAREGKPCWLCSEKIIKIELSSRRLYMCPNCQSLERNL